MEIIKFEAVNKIYTMGNVDYKALDNINISLNEGELITILGPSGAGKSTFLNLIGGLDSPTNGKIVVDNTDISTLNQDELADYRANKVGFIFQFYNLLSTLTVKENVELVKDICKDYLPIVDILKEVGLEDKLNKFPYELSGGEQQRVSIARTIVKNPRIILCDEPTGALDSNTGIKVLKLLYKMAKERKKTIIIVTHNNNIAKISDTVVNIKNGKITNVIKNDNPLKIDELEL